MKTDKEIIETWKNLKYNELSSKERERLCNILEDNEKWETILSI